MRLQVIAGGFAAAAVVIAGASVASGQSSTLDKAAKLRNPKSLTETAPATYKANFDTTKGTFVIQVNRDWAPIGADRFYNLVKNGFYDDVRFFRVIPNFMVQFGMHGHPAVTSAWQGSNLKDDPVKQSNKTGYVTFAKTAAPNSRTHAGLHQLQGQCVSRRPGLRAVRRRSFRAWMSSTSSTPNTGGRTVRKWPGSGRAGRQRVS